MKNSITLKRGCYCLVYFALVISRSLGRIVLSQNKYTKTLSRNTHVDAFLRSVLQLRQLYFKDESDFSFNLTINMASQKCRCKIKGNKKCSQRQMNSRTRKACAQPLISPASTSPFPPEGFQRSRS